MLRRVLLLLLALFLLSSSYRIYVRKHYIWLLSYIQTSLSSSEMVRRPVHVFFLVADHFEPGRRKDILARWERDYPVLAARHRDSGGRPVQHTWFYPGEQPLDANLEALQRLVVVGYGEVELHYHHGGDSIESTRRKFSAAIEWFQHYGFLRTADGRTSFAFVHGNWALDNSEGPSLCGVNRELALLRELGCFADFTFPALWREAQPAWVNRIAMATDDEKPKSYDRSVPVRVGSAPSGDLLIFQGPLQIYPVWDPRWLWWRVEDGDIHPSVPVDERRVDLWIRANIHVPGKADWIFVKVHGHGASSDGDAEEFLGRNFERALSHLESRYNDGVHYILHYVTAREAYNLVRAAEAGVTGQPERYYDYVIKPYVASAGSHTASK